MGSEMTTKVRLVRCPKCSKVLPELPEFNVYKCGGCGATLQAKHRVNSARSIESSPHDAVPVQDNQTDRVREEKECCSADKDVLPSLDDCSSFQNHESDHSQSVDFDAEQPRGMSLSIENQNDRSRRSNSSDCDNEGSEVSNEVFSPTDFVDDKSEDFAPNGDSELANAGTSFTNHELEHNENEELADKEESPDDENEGCDDHVNEQFAHCEIEEFARHTENEESSREFADNENEELSRKFANAGIRFSNRELESNENEEFADNEEEEESADDENEGCDDHVNEQFAHCDIEEFARNAENDESSREFADNKNEEFSQELDRAENKEFAQEKNAECARTENESLARANLEAAVKQEGSTLAESNTESASKKNDSDSKVKSSSAVKFVATAGSVSNASDHVPAKESLALGTLVSPHGELKQPEKSVHRLYGRLSSEEFNPSSELSGTSGETSKSPTRSAHAYEASISSYEGMDDSLPRHQMHSFKGAYKAPKFLHSEERPRREKFVERTMMNRDSDMQHQDRASWSEKNHGIRNDKWDRGEFLEPAARNDQTAWNWRPEIHDHQPSSAFHRVAPRSGFENGGPSNQLHEKFQRHSSFQSEWSEDPEQMMKLLKMVFEMQNQRDKSYPPYDKGNDRISGVSQKPRYDLWYHDYNTHRAEHFRHSNDPRYLGRYASGSNYADWRRPKKIPFSGEAISRSHQLDPSCSHFFPQEWSHSAQLPRPSRYDTAGLCRLHPGHSYCTCYNAFPPSPQWSVDSEYHPWGRETQSDDQHRRSQDMTSHFLRERHRAAKRHFRPIAGGAPFVVCYKCHIVLQLPADFLLFKKKCHRLKCSACSEVLKFSLKKGCHIVRYRAKIVNPPPPTEAEDYGDVDRGNEASTSQVPQADPVSYSDDYGHSHRKSCSIEGDPGSTTPIQTPLGVAFDRILYGSYDPSEDSKELVPEPSAGTYKNRPPRYESSRPSSSISKSKKPSSEIQEEQPRSTSPLHRLMGYSSPSQVILGSRPYGQQISNSYSMQRDK